MSTLTAELAIDTEAIFESVSNVFIIGIFLNIATLVIGVLLIYFVVRKWSFKLRQMTDEISEIRKNNQSLGRLTVPENPVEMYEVATAFNQLMEAQHKAMEREKQFITDASHELRTPLAAIRGHVQLIKRRGNDHPEIIQESIHFIDQESKRIEKMSNQLLTLEKYEQQSTEKLNLSDLVQDEIEKMSFLHDYLVEYEIEDAILFHAAKTDIQEILQNLLENAIKYTDAHKKIAVFLKENEKSIELLVEDNGIGIPDEAKEKIFERFYRVDSSHSSEIEGTGIGLSIVKKMVEKYHGTLIVRDNKPKGTVFQITFPK
ncbi:Signal transduction histidine-protein kinase ArlS [Listeria fleischmannii subsp. fleischmannii]|uniref:histidine kinase n=2 Tax=Listeria fleischmannii TaxID=1069827 RepID=A0A2X3H1P1_9LIST|nr:HAMP domain-containing sensor histidine kinase [Listeria fleischmannii]SQC68466.1 Signal transduction histidine-protein kinase ArlS [Listeria fleischmannii subsp. fleischmannii]